MFCSTAHTYRSYSKLAPYKRIFREGVPILTYHKIGNPPYGVRIKNLYVPPRAFERQLKELHRAGFGTRKLHEWANFTQSNHNQLVLTFDDGSTSVFESACEFLSKFNFSAIQYLVADLIGGKNQWDIVKGEVEDQLMDDFQVRTWLSAGHEIGSHTLTHPHLTRLDERNAREEIFSSKRKLEDRFGVPIQHFCYPYGSWKPWIRDLVEEAGYQTAVTTNPGICVNVKDPFTLPRINVRPPPINWDSLLDRFLRNG